MIEIIIRTAKLDESISDLKSLRSQCQNFDINYPNTVGGGRTVDELECMAKLYQDINNKFIELINNTISFMENLKDSFEESDRKAADKIGGIIENAIDAIGTPIHTGGNHHHGPYGVGRDVAREAMEIAKDILDDQP